MQPSSRPNEAQRIVSTLIVVVLFLLLSSISIPRHGSGGFLKGQLTQTMNNARQLYIASYSMATDHGTTGDELLGWPGDLAERKARPVTTVSGYIERLIEGGYLNRSDMANVLKAPGVLPWDTSKPIDPNRHCPFKIYRVKESDGPTTLFCASRNLTYNQGLDEKKVPYGNKGFVVVRKGGDGLVFNNKKQATGNLGALGLLPGRTDSQTRNKEEPGDSLEMK
jgi:hypothetical protein